MGFLPAAAVPAAAGAGPAAPIVLGAAAIGGAFAKLFTGAKQRGADEKRSDPWLQEAVDSIYVLKNQASTGQITKAKASELFSKVLAAYIAKINTLKTRSVVESRRANQTRDLQQLFDREMSTVPDSMPAGAGSGSADAIAYGTGMPTAPGGNTALWIGLGLVALLVIAKD